MGLLDSPQIVVLLPFYLAATMGDAEALFGKLKADANCKSLLKKNLTDEVFNECKDKKTKFNGTLANCIRSGCENTDSGVGVYASDPEAYTTFAPLLDAVIKDYHKVDTLNHPNPDFGNVDNLDFGDLDPSGNMIVSTRVRVGRSHDSYGFPPVLNKEQRKGMETMAVAALQKLDGEHSGTYYPLEGMSPETQKQLTEDHFLFNDSDRFLRAASGYDDWPTGRGIFHNKDKTFLVWVNEEDHLRLISMQMGANLGATLRASVHIKIPKLSALPEFKQFCDNLNIQARGIHGEHTESVGGVYDISNKRRLGLTEFQAIQEMRKGVEECIKKEKSL